MQTMTTVRRLVAGLFGGFFALLAIVIPILDILSLYNESELGSMNPTHHLILSWGGYRLTILTGFVFCALMSAVLLRYASRGRALRSFLRG